MREKKMLFIFTAVIILIFASVSFAAIPVEVVVSKETVLTLKAPIERVSIANPDIAGMTLISPTEIVINGKKSGITSLIVWDLAGNKTFFDVIVKKESLAEIEKEMAEGIEKKIKAETPDSDVKVEIVGGTIVLRGTAYNRQKIDKIENIAMLYAPKDCEGTSRSCSLPEGCVARKGSEAKGGGGSILPIVPLEGTPGGMSPAGKGVLIEQITERKALCVLNLITMPEAQQVILEVKVAQIDKTKLKELGISFLIKQKNFELTAPGLYTSPSGTVGGFAEQGIVSTSEVTPGIGGFDIGSLSPQIGVAHFPSDIAVVLRALQEKGFGKILAEPNLVVRSGEQGNFHVGSRIPIQTVTGVGTAATLSITYEEVGVRLNFAPEVLETGAIRLKIDPAEVSSVARYITFQGIIAPEIDTRRVITSVDLKEGESLILAGLLSDEMKKNIQKVPILGDIPILGAFFRSTTDELKEKELAFFITPRLVKPFAPGVKPALPTDNQPTPEEMKEFDWIPVPGAMK
jgi:pilus assembly protein CpaC